MKLYLPHREADLSVSLGYNERNELIHSILEEKLDFHEEVMSVEEYLRRTWNRDSSKVLMDIIGYYLTKNNFEGEDREVLSNGKVKEMKKGSKRMTAFSGMGLDNQVGFGVVDADDYSY